jgi:hypothetical protein
MYGPIAYAINETRIFLTFHIFELGTGSTELNYAYNGVYT